MIEIFYFFHVDVAENARQVMKVGGEVRRDQADPRNDFLKGRNVPHRSGNGLQCRILKAQILKSLQLMRHHLRNAGSYAELRFHQKHVPPPQEPENGSSRARRRDHGSVPCHFLSPALQSGPHRLKIAVNDQTDAGPHPEWNGSLKGGASRREEILPRHSRSLLTGSHGDNGNPPHHPVVAKTALSTPQKDHGIVACQGVRNQ